MRFNLPVVAWYVVVVGLFLVATVSGLVPFHAGIALLLAVCFACELMDSSLGMGYGTTLTPVLLAFGYDPLQLVPTILVSEFLSGFAAFFFHAEAGNISVRRGSTHVRTGLLLAACSVVGVAAGVQLALNVSKIMLNRIIGVVIVAAGVMILVAAGRTFVYRGWKIAMLGLVASFNKAVSGGGYGPIMTSGQILGGVEGKAAVGITSFAEGFTCIAGTLLFLLAGKRLEPTLLVPVVTGALLSVPFSAQIIKVSREELIKKAVAVVTVGLGLFTLIRTLL
jgi:uncharacterized membrane protein YfcA